MSQKDRGLRWVGQQFEPADSQSQRIGTIIEDRCREVTKLVNQ
jgi:hypothetical protein